MDFFSILLRVCFSLVLFLWIRNEWVLSARLSMINQDHDLYKKLPSYNNMMCKFWIWDVNKFIRQHGISA